MEWNTVERAFLDRDRHKNRLKRRGNIPTTWRWARGDGRWNNRSSQHARQTNGPLSKTNRISRFSLRAAKQLFHSIELSQYVQWRGGGGGPNWSYVAPQSSFWQVVAGSNSSQRVIQALAVGVCRLRLHDGILWLWPIHAVVFSCRSWRLSLASTCGRSIFLSVMTHSLAPANTCSRSIFLSVMTAFSG